MNPPIIDLSGFGEKAVDRQCIDEFERVIWSFRPISKMIPMQKPGISKSNTCRTHLVIIQEPLGNHFSFSEDTQDPVPSFHTLPFP